MPSTKVPCRPRKLSQQKFEPKSATPSSNQTIRYAFQRRSPTPTLAPHPPSDCAIRSHPSRRRTRRQPLTNRRHDFRSALDAAIPAGRDHHFPPRELRPSGLSLPWKRSALRQMNWKNRCCHSCYCRTCRYPSSCCRSRPPDSPGILRDPHHYHWVIGPGSVSPRTQVRRKSGAQPGCPPSRCLGQ